MVSPGTSGCQTPSIVKLDAAEHTVVKLPAGHFFHQVKEAAIHRVDLVRRLQLRKPVGSATRAAALFAQSIQVAPGNEEGRLAITAFENS
jgi:hypothetical protein